MDDYQHVELERRVRNGMRIGVIFEVDYNQPAYRVRDGEFESDWLYPLTDRASNDVSWKGYEVGEQVAFLMESGGEGVGVILGAIYQNKHPAPDSSPDVRSLWFGGGDFVSHDRRSNRLTIKFKGDVVLQAGSLVVEQGNISVPGGDVVASGISLVGHKHGGVLPGKALTDKPG